MAVEKLDKNIYSEYIVALEDDKFTVNPMFYDHSFGNPKDSIFDYLKFAEPFWKHFWCTHQERMDDMAKENSYEDFIFELVKNSKRSCFMKRKNHNIINPVLMGTMADQPPDVFSFFISNAGYTFNAVSELKNSKHRFVICSENELIGLMELMEQQFYEIKDSLMTRSNVDTRNEIYKCIKSIKTEGKDVIEIFDNRIITSGNES
ncbi:27718_t:CDS:2, partial [Dentiscutata erythropus]